LESVRLPLIAIVRGPLLWILATTSGYPDADRFALSLPMTKFEGGAPPDPIDTYMRMPTRFASFTPPDPDVETSAQTTAYRSPDEALFGTRMVTVSNALAPACKRTTSRLTDVQ